MNIEPCMWCGNLDLRVTQNPGYEYVHCRACEAYGPIKESQQEAIEAWNEVARIVREARNPKAIYLDGEELRKRGITQDVLKEYMEQLTISPSFAIQEMFIYRGMRYEIIWEKTESEDAYFVKINDYLYDNEHETFTDAYAWMLNEVDILIAAREERNTE